MDHSDRGSSSSPLSMSDSIFSGAGSLSEMCSNCEETLICFLKAKDIDHMHKLRRELTKEILQDHEESIKQVIENGFTAADIRGTQRLPDSTDEFFPFQSLCNLLMNPFVITSDSVRSDMIKRALLMPPCEELDTPNYAIRLSACVGAQTIVIDPEIKQLLRDVIDCETIDSLLSNRACVAYAAVYLTKQDMESVIPLLIHPQYLVRQNIKAWIFKQLYEEVMNFSEENWKTQVVAKLVKYLDDNIDPSPLQKTVKKDFLSDLEKFRHEKSTTGFSKMNQYQMLAIPNVIDLHKLEGWKKTVFITLQDLKSNGTIPTAVIEEHFHVPKVILSPYDLNNDGILTENEALQLSYMISKKH